MFLNKSKAGAVVLMTSWMMANFATPATAANRIFTPDGKLVYVNVYSVDKNFDQNFLHNFVNVNILPEIKRVRGVGTAVILGNRGNEVRIRLNPDRMRAYNLSTDDIKNAVSVCSVIGSPERFATKTGPSSEYELTHTETGRDNKPEQYENIILKASPDGEILRLKDVAQVELGASFYDVSSDIDGHPAATIVLKQAPGSSAAEVIKLIKEKLGDIKEKLLPPGMDFQVIPLDSRDVFYAVIETPRDSTLEDTRARCHELSAIAMSIDGVTSVVSLAGYQIRTEGHDLNAGTCLIHLKDQAGRKRTSRQIIEKLAEKCRTMRVNFEFFEPPAVTVFVADGGFLRACPGQSELERR